MLGERQSQRDLMEPPEGKDASWHLNIAMSQLFLSFLPSFLSSFHFWGFQDRVSL